MLALIFSLMTAQAATKASSELTDDNGRHPAAAAFDGLLGQGWAEGETGYGEGAWVEVDLGAATDIKNVTVWPGNLSQGARTYREYSRPRALQVEVDGAAVGDPVRLEDKMQRVDIPLEARGRKVRVVVTEVYEGIVFSDLFISEVAINFPDRGPLGKLDAWTAGREAASLYEKYTADVEARYVAYKAAEFGDPEALAWLMQAVAEGPPYLAGKVKSLVPDGYRAQAIKSDELAQTAVRKLQDANGISSFQLAMLRATGDEEEALKDTVEIFAAFQELIGGGNRNVPYWGQTGWEPGALRGFGEPLSLVVDRDGKVFVADTGNNRVQVFSDQGRPDRQWGPKPEITDAWFDTGRKWYVSGAAPGEKAGEFWSPIDIVIIPEKDADGFAVLDALGRVQVFDSTGRQTISWTVQTGERATAGYGGTGHLLWVSGKKRLYALIGDEAVGYTLTGEEVSRWKIADGTPRDAVSLKSGKLVLAFYDGLITYDPDGFRYGVLTNRDSLGAGYESVGLAVDEKGKLWALTDVGIAVKLKGSGKVDWQVPVVSYPLYAPRLIVQDGMLYFTSEDKVKVVDALQAKLDVAQEKKDEASGDFDLDLE